MKKITAMLLALCVLLGSAGALADAGWNDISAAVDALGLKHTWTTYRLSGCDVRFWLPDQLIEQKVSPEDAANGVVAGYKPVASGNYLDISAWTPRWSTLQEYLDFIRESVEVTQTIFDTINGIPVMIITVPQGDRAIITYALNDQQWFQLTFWGQGTDGFINMAIVMMHSVHIPEA